MVNVHARLANVIFFFFLWEDMVGCTSVNKKALGFILNILRGERWHSNVQESEHMYVQKNSVNCNNCDFVEIVGHIFCAKLFKKGYFRIIYFIQVKLSTFWSQPTILLSAWVYKSKLEHVFLLYQPLPPATYLPPPHPSSLNYYEMPGVYPWHFEI